MWSFDILKNNNNTNIQIRYRALTSAYNIFFKVFLRPSNYEEKRESWLWLIDLLIRKSNNEENI